MTRLYFRELDRHQLMTADQEIEAACEIEAGRKALVRCLAELPEAWRPAPARRQARITRLLRLTHRLSERWTTALGEGDTTALARELEVAPERLEALIAETEAAARRIQQARQRLLEAASRLVVSIARRHAGRGLELMDLVQEGNAGLLRATETFDAQRGCRFSTYAMWWIRQSVTRAVAEQSRTIRLPLHVVEGMQRVSRCARRLAQETGREPTLEEIAEGLDLPVAKVRMLLEVGSEPISLEREAAREGETPLADVLEDPAAPPAAAVAGACLVRTRVESLLATLAPREREILELRFGLEDGRPRTLDEVASLQRVTRERVRQLEARALEKLRRRERDRETTEQRVWRTASASARRQDSHALPERGARGERDAAHGAGVAARTERSHARRALPFHAPAGLVYRSTVVGASASLARRAAGF